MSKTNRKWKVFVIVLCMLFTMTPATVFATESADSPTDLVNVIEGQSTINPETTPGPVTLTVDEVTPPGIKGTGGLLPLYEESQSKKPQKPTTLAISKVIVGDIPDSPKEFTFKIYKQKCDLDDTGHDSKEFDRDDHGHDSIKFENKPMHTVIVEGNSSSMEFDVDPNLWYKVEEVDDLEDDYTPVSKSLQYKIEKGTSYVFEFTNTYKEPTSTVNGSIKIIKDIQGDQPPTTPDKFTFNITGEGFTDTRDITGENDVTINNLTPGAYTITEAKIPNYTSSTSSIEVIVTASEDPKVVTFVNIYDAPELKAYITKTVALYDGVNIPTTGFTDQLDLTALNQQVIYKIEPTCDDNWYGYVYLYDSYNGTNITNNLQVLDGGILVDAKDVISNYAEGFALNVEVYHTFYFIDTMTANGTYINTVNLYESNYEEIPTLAKQEDEPIDSSSATVVVNYTPPNNNDNSHDHSSTHYYDVTYNANYPTGAALSGTVPKDTNDYNYNSKVSVRENSGDLKAGTYTFIGWNTKADGTGTMYLPGSTFNITADTILYAQWKLASEPAATVVDPNTGTDDGSAVAAETAKATGLDDVPKTGTSNPLLPMFLLGLLSLAGITICRKKVLER